jgi:CO/xanthine dehydrogenase FAD-binding subunit
MREKESMTRKSKSVEQAKLLSAGLEFLTILRESDVDNNHIITIVEFEEAFEEVRTSCFNLYYY